MNTLQVPYVSQITPGATLHNNDCGAASVLMVLRAYRLALATSVDQIYDSIHPGGDVALSAGGLQSLLASPLYGVKNKWLVDLKTSNLFEVLVGNLPAIALIHYAVLVKAGLTEKTGFLGAHFVVVIGVDIKNVCINDPYSTGSGAGREIPIAVWKDAWAQCALDGNPNGGAILMTVPIQDLSISVPPPSGVKYLLKINGINVRAGAISATAFVRTIWRSVNPSVMITGVPGEWGKLADGTGWVFMEFLTKAA